MSDAMIEKFRTHNDDRYCRPNSNMPDVHSLTDDITRHFRKNYPVMLDGALPRSGDRRNFIRHARETLVKGRIGIDMLPAAILREALDSVSLPGGRDSVSSVKAGLTAVGPKTGRVWWDESVLDNLEDVLARLDQPRAVLRFYDVTGLNPDSGRWNEFFDIDVDIDRHGQTVNFWSDDRAYVVDLGYIHADGRFLSLARTNFVHLPREGRGAADNGETACSLLKPRVRRVDAEVVPDECAREWAAGRRDYEDRDLETELVVHMVYRSFLREGPRALRRAPSLFRRDLEVLRREFARRQRVRERGSLRAAVEAPAFLVARLDAVREVPFVEESDRIPAVAWRSELAVSVEGFTRDSYMWFDGLIDSVRRVDASGAMPVGEDSVVRVETENEDVDDLVASVSAGGRSASYVSSSVFEAAKNLRESLVEMPSLADDLRDDDDEAEVSEESGRPVVDESLKVFGGSEAKRMAKAGVRITRMALTLEGRMRPGARLKVAGKLVHADADGRFRLECVLTGRRASIPMRAGASIGGEARSLINVEWEKRASREKKKVW